MDYGEYYKSDFDKRSVGVGKYCLGLFEDTADMFGRDVYQPVRSVAEESGFSRS